MAETTEQESEDLRQRLVDIGIALSAERDHDRLLERILLEAKRICNSDGGTLYLREGDDTLRFAIMRTDSLGIALGGTTDKEIPYPPLPLRDKETGEPNVNNVATYVALKGVTVSITDAYSTKDFDFAGTKAHDRKIGYRSTSFLTVPLKNAEDSIIGVLQLINSRHPSGVVVPFPERLQPIVNALGSQAAVAIENHNLMAAQKRLLDSFRRLVDIGIALSAEKNFDRLLEQILLQAKAFCNADGGTLYLRGEEDGLEFAMIHNDSLGIAMGGTTGEAIAFDPVPLLDERRMPNLHNVASYVAHRGATVNIADAYSTKDFDFSGVVAFDNKNQYRSTSFLTVPLKNHEGEIIGVLQIINALDRNSGDVIPFSLEMQTRVEALSSQAAVAIDNQNLLKQQKVLLESFIRLIAKAIDRKSPYTGAHCQRVPVIVDMLAAAACQEADGPYRDFDLDEEKMYELRIAAWIHDCGKVTTPEYVVDKATKLETIYDRIETVKTRFEVLKRDAEIQYLRALAEKGADAGVLERAYEARLAEIDDDRRFIEEVNFGGESMPVEAMDRVRAIAKRRWRDWEGTERDFLSEDETLNLNIPKGTLTDEERMVINDHIVATIEMLDQLPFPKNLARVPDYAGSHHEKLDGTGYPRGLTADQLSIPARMVAIADIFEALTASDRPYKAVKSLSECVRIMWSMARGNHIDGDLFELLLRSGVYREYADIFLDVNQIDEVDVDAYLGGDGSGVMM